MWTVIIFVLVLVMIMWHIREQIPRGFSQPWRLRLFLALARLSLEVGWILERLGLLSLIGVTNAMAKVVTHMDPRFRKGRATDMLFDGVKVRMYSPRQNSQPDPSGYPALVFYHGGGWAIGNTRIYDDFVIPISNGLDIIIVSVEYRLSPKHKFPVPLDDCLTATKYFIEHAEGFGVNSKRIAVGGDSAGGNLAAAVSLRLRDEMYQTMPKLQVLVYPVLQSLDYALPSMIQNGKGPLLTTYWLAYYTSLYATGTLKHVSAIRRNQHTTPEVKKQMYNTCINHGHLDAEYHYKPYQKPDLDHGSEQVWSELKDVMMNPYFSPLVAEDLSGLPEAFVYTPRYDVLRDEGILYAKRLVSAGVPATHILGKSALHGICTFRHIFPKESYEGLNSIINFLKAKL
jgi:acetyl esterase/lipase